MLKQGDSCWYSYEKLLKLIAVFAKTLHCSCNSLQIEGYLFSKNWM